MHNLKIIQQWQALPPAWRDSLIIFWIGRVLFSLWGVVLWTMGMRLPHHTYLYFEVPSITEGVPGALLGMWQRWDTIHYLRIVLNGYHAEDLTAFYPLFPLLGRGLVQVTGMDATLALVLISNVCFFFSLVLLHQLVSEQVSPDLARPTLLGVLIFPFAFYNYAAYPQSLLLLLTLLGYRLALRRRWAGAALVNLLAGLTHSTAVLLSLLLIVPVYQFIKSGRGWWRWLTLIVPFTNGLGIALFLAWRQSAGWPPYPDTLARLYARGMDWPWQAVAIYADYIIHLPAEISYLVPWIGVTLFFVTIALAVWGVRWLPRTWWVYQLVMIIFLMSNTIKGAPMIAFLRYCLVMFPLFVEIGRLQTYPRWRLIVFALGITLGLLLSAMFFMWRGDVI